MTSSRGNTVWMKNDFLIHSSMNFAGSITVSGGADLCKPINIWRTSAKNPNAENAVWTHSVVLPPPGHDEMRVCNDDDKWTCNGVGETPVACRSTIPITTVGATSTSIVTSGGSDASTSSSSSSDSSSSSSSSNLENDLSAIATALKSGGSIAFNFA